MSGKRARKKRERYILLKAFSAVLAAGLILLLAMFLLFGVKDKEEDSLADSVQETEVSGTDAEPEVKEDLPEEIQEDPQASYEPEETGTEVQLSTVKKIATETEDITLGIDVSEFQGNINWEEAAQSGIDFVMVRTGYRTAGSGQIREDACARYNLQEAQKYGIHLGAYFFSTAVTEEEAREEAQWVKDFLAGYPMTYPVAYNCEGFQNTSSRQYSLTVEERSKLAEVFLDDIEAGGYTGMFYAAKNELAGNQLWTTETLELKYRIWVAQYSSVTYPEIQNPDYMGKYAMWQYTNKGSVSGIDEPVDLNVAYFGYSETTSAQQEGAAQHVEADPEVGVTFEEVNEQVTSKDVTNLRSTMEQGSDENVVEKLRNGDTAVRTGKGNNGWSRVEYNGQTLYAVSSYLTTDLSYTPPAEEPDDGFKTKFTAVTENVTAKDVTNLRNRPSVEAPSEVIVQLHNGEVIARTGVSDLGWSRVEYNGQTLYCISSYLQVVE
ncbi:MAG: glycoside hydrolase family 25 [Clostridiales bacterium]|nr:glycoside hydrolase family 25 [Clostridiales bacterium]